MNSSIRAVALLVSTASVAALSFGLSVGCSSQPANHAASDAGAGADALPPPPDLSCLQILQCIVACPDADAACPDACANKGSVEGKSTVLAFAACVDKEKCTDAACAQGKCGATLDECVASSTPKPGGSPLAGSAPPGSVPADLVGTWSGARNGVTERLVFNADGSGSWTTSDVTEYLGCFSFTRNSRSGNVVVTDTKITVYATSVVQSVQRCNPPAVDTKLTAVTQELQWHRDSTDSYHEADPNTIFIIDSACAAKYPGKEDCNTLGCPIGLYCTSRVKRE